MVLDCYVQRSSCTGWSSWSGVARFGGRGKPTSHGNVTAARVRDTGLGSSNLSTLI